MTWSSIPRSLSWQLARLVLVLTALVSPTAVAQQPIKSGASWFEVAGAAPDGTVMTVWTYRRKAYQPSDRIVFVMHGLKRNADTYRDNWIELAERYHLLIAAPDFSDEQFPGVASYNLGGMVDRDRRPQPPERWAWQSIEKIFDGVRAASGSKRKTYTLFGHSAGAQFVHRFILFSPRARIDAAIAANAGWYTLPIRAERFPYGLKGIAVGEQQLKQAFARPLTVLLGAWDNNPDAPHLRRTKAALRQGAGRLDRGQNFVRVAGQEADRLGTAFGWRLQIVPRTGHDGAGMSEAAAALLFAGPK
jgi:poly(3-hydroxybutyrate) depolymerase